jgi:hypothetical protein
MSDEDNSRVSNSTQPSASKPSHAMDPSVGVRLAQQAREAVTDLGGLALAAYLVHRGSIQGTHALYFALVLLLPSSILLRLARILGARNGSAGAGAVIALLGASAAYAQLKSYGVAFVGVVGIAACVGSCASLPARDGCEPSIVRCSAQGVPQLCDPQGRWTPMDDRCAAHRARCCIVRGSNSRLIAACLPEQEQCDDRAQ